MKKENWLKFADGVLNMVIFVIKIIVLVVLALWFVYDGVVSFFAPWYEWSLFVCMMLGSLLSLLGSMIPKVQKVSYVSFCLFFIGYVLMYFYLPSIVEQHGVDRCLDSGKGVWDYDEHRCRQDCWKWDKEHGCYRDDVVSER